MHSFGLSANSSRSVGTETGSTAADLEAQSTIEKSSKALVIEENTRTAIGDKIAFILLEDNISNTTLTCDSLGVQYTIETTGKCYHARQITTITRIDMKNEKSVLVAEWERNWVTDRVRLLKSVSNELLPINDVLHRVWKFPFFLRLNFTIEASGKRYRWVSYPWSLKLYTEHDNTTTEPMVFYSHKRSVRKKRKAFLAFSPGYDVDIQDDIIVTWALSLRRRYKNDTVFHLVKFLLFDFLVLFLIDFYTSRK